MFADHIAVLAERKKRQEPAHLAITVSKGMDTQKIEHQTSHRVKIGAF